MVTVQTYNASNTANTATTSGWIITYGGGSGTNTMTSDTFYVDNQGILRDRKTNTEIALSDLVQQCLKIKRDEWGNNSGTIILPDGSMLVFDEDGNYEVIAAGAKVIYKANYIREFNKFINASDLLEQFIRDLGAVGCTQDKVLQVPLEIFVNWLIIKAAEQDNDDFAMQGVPRLEDKRDSLVRSHCKSCGRYLSKEYQKAEVNFCNDACFNRYMTKRQLV